MSEETEKQLEVGTPVRILPDGHMARVVATPAVGASSVLLVHSGAVCSADLVPRENVVEFVPEEALFRRGRELEAEVARLRALVKDAYFEGYNDGDEERHEEDSRHNASCEWPDSAACKSLEAPQHD